MSGIKHLRGWAYPSHPKFSIQRDPGLRRKSWYEFGKTAHLSTLRAPAYRVGYSPKGNSIYSAAPRHIRWI